MNKFWALAFTLGWLLTQSASADRLDRDGNYGGGGGEHASNGGNAGGTGGGGSLNGDGQHFQSTGGGQRTYNHRGNHALGHSNYRAYHSGRANATNFNRAPHVNRARADAYSPSHFSYVRSASVAVPGRFRTMGVRSVPRPLTNRAQYITSNRGHSTISLPRTGPNGLALSTHVMARTQIGSAVVQQHMASLGANNVEMNRINHYNQIETRPNYYYWHSYNGYNYCHYYDPWGYHWYGWYIGDSCFWTRYYWGNWWWYDSAEARWCYWHDGGWWWNDPDNTTTVYVYENGDYNPVNTDTSADAAPAAPSDQAAAPNSPAISTAPIAQKKIYKSPDGSRVVKIFGDSNDAILSDAANPPKLAAVFLGSNAQSVKFNAASDGSTQITVTFIDGSVKTFDEQGTDLDAGDDDQPDSGKPASPQGNNS
jgi:hypothetical protein